MRKLIQFFGVLLVLVLVSGCTLFPMGTGVQVGQEQPKAAWDLFDYSALDTHSNEFLVKVTDFAALDAFAAEHGATVLKTWPEIHWALLKVAGDGGEFLQAARFASFIVLAEPNMLYEIPDPFDSRVDLVEQELAAEEYAKQWGLDNINAPAAWAVTTGDASVVVGIIDTGVETTHPEFADTVWEAPFDATGEGFELFDFNGHGTHVAGIAAADGRSGQIAGVVWDSPIMPIRVMDIEGAIWTDYLTDAMIYAGDYAEANPDKRLVLNMSIGGRGYSFAFKDAIDYAASRGVLLVTSAGNSYRRIISYPSAYNGVVSVAASTPYNTKASFSTEGWWNSVAAPGVLIYSTYVNGAYTNLQGTSMASPFVAGAAALLLAQYPGLTPVEIKNQLEQTAQGSNFSEQLGHGVIDAAALLGPLAQMVYGGLTVSSDAPAWEAVFTVMNAATNTLVTHGSSGEDGGHKFWALSPGTYNVIFSAWDGTAGDFVVDQKQVTITAGVTAQLDFQMGAGGQAD